MGIPGAVLAACAVACAASLPAHALEDLPTLYINATGPLTPLDHGLLAVPPVDGSYKILHNAPGMVVLGDTVVLWLVTHDDGRLESYRQIVTARDVDPPFFVDAPAEHAVERTGKRTSVTFPVPAAADAVDLDVDVSSSHGQGSKFRPGNTTVVFTATDDSGNSATHEMVVRVEERRIRGLVLEVMHDEIRASWDPLSGDPTYRVSLAGPGGDVLEISRTPKPFHVFGGLDADTEYVVAVSEAGRRSTQAEISAVTLQPPELYIIVPDDIVREAVAPLTRVLLGGLLTPEAWDPAPSVSNDAPDAFPVGKTVVTWTATDGTVTISGTQLVTITDTTPPVFSGLPGPSTHVPESRHGVAVHFELPTASDAADPDVRVSSSPEPGSLFPIGDTTVTFTARDRHGNEVISNVTVTVLDRPPIRGVTLESTNTTVTASWEGPGLGPYRVVLAEDSTGKRVSSQAVRSTTHVFEGLDHATAYVFEVYYEGDESTKQTATVYTKPRVVKYIADAEVESWDVSYAYAGNRDHYANFTFAVDDTEGRPPPSLAMVGDGLDSVGGYIIHFGVGDRGNDDLHLSFDYKIVNGWEGRTTAYYIYDYRTARYNIADGILDWDNGTNAAWQTLNFVIPDERTASGWFGFSVTAYDRNRGDAGDYELYIDNVSLSYGSPLVFRDGSAGQGPPAQEGTWDEPGVANPRGDPSSGVTVPRDDLLRIMGPPDGT